MLKKICKFCGQEFETMNKKKKFCSRSCANSHRWTDDNYRSQFSKTMKHVMNDPDVKRRMSETMKKVSNRDDVKKAFTERMKEFHSKPEQRHINSERQRKRFEDEDFRNDHSKKIKEYQNREDVKKQKSVFQKERQKDPFIKQEQSLRSQLFWEDPINRKNQSEMMLEWWSNPKNAESRKSTLNGYGKYKNFELPSGRIVKLQGYEPQVLVQLLKEYEEDDIVIGVKEMNKEIGRIKYFFDNKERTYYPDFYIKSTNTIIEVKSIFTFEKEKDKNLAKEQACIEQGFYFEFIIL